MLILLKYFDKSGKLEGTPMIMHNGGISDTDSSCIAKVIREANGGITITSRRTDEFGNDTMMEFHLDQFDLEQIQKL